jgi:hypothetical protein
MLTKWVLVLANRLNDEADSPFRRWWGPGKTLPIFGFLFGLFSFVMAFVHTFGAAVAVRFREYRLQFPSSRTWADSLLHGRL